MYQPDTLKTAGIPGFTYTQRPLGDAARKRINPKAGKSALEHHLVFDGTSALATTLQALTPEGWRSWNSSSGTSGTDHDWRGTVKAVREGDSSFVARSDALLAKFEDMVPQRTGWRVVDDVVGSVPNVPAYLAGHPLAMRRRIRVAKEQAPLAILVDMAASASVSRDTIAKKGALALALVRALSARRPVTLYVTACLAAGHPGNPDGQSSGAFVTCKIETQPLDLARAAYMLGSADWRHWAFGLSHVVGFDPTMGWGSWPYHDATATKGALRDILAGIIPEADELLCITSLYLKDAHLDDPEAWLKEQLEKFGHVDLDDAA